MCEIGFVEPVELVAIAATWIDHFGPRWKWSVAVLVLVNDVACRRVFVARLEMRKIVMGKVG
jgi:hypothetical protein